MAKQLLTPLSLIVRMSFSLENHSCELLNLTGMVGKVELISTFTTAVCESWNMSDKYTWDNAGDLNQLSMDQTLSEDNRSDFKTAENFSNSKPRPPGKESWAKTRPLGSENVRIPRGRPGVGNGQAWN